MPSITKILVPVDFSSSSDAALDYAVFLARRFDAAVDLLHVWEPVLASPSGPATDRMIPADDPTGEAHEAHGAIDLAMRARLETASASLVQARGQVEHGEAKSSILRVAQQDGYDLIVLGTHGRRGLARLVLGSVAEEVVRRSPIPVLVVHDGVSS